MQALKVLVIVMGVLIIVAITLLGYGLVTRVTKTGDSRGLGDARGLGDVDLALPAGCAIAAAESDGDRLIVRVDGPAERGCQQVVVIDLADGTELGRIKAVTGPR